MTLHIDDQSETDVGLRAMRDVQGSMFPEIQPDKPIGPIPASVQTGTNADLIAKIAPLYLTGSVLDVTYGEGKWWDRFTPDPFTYHDLHKVDGVDFRDLPHADGSFDTVCYDPPYVLSGGESTAALASDLQDRFGIGTARLGHNGWTGFEALVRGGLSEVCRVSRGFVLVKCMEFAQGGGVTGGFRDVPFLMRQWAHAIGMQTHDVIVHHAGSGPGGHNIFTPKRTRRHHSYLIVLRCAGGVPCPK